MNRRKVQGLSIRAIGLVVGLLVAGCNPAAGDSVYLPVLLADPMSNYEHPDLVETRRSEEGYNPSGFLSKPVQPSVVMQFVADEMIPSEVTSDIVGAAEVAGWTFESVEPTVGTSGETRSWSARKPVEVGTAFLRITSWDKELEISLEMGFVDVP